MWNQIIRIKNCIKLKFREFKKRINLEKLKKKSLRFELSSPNLPSVKKK
jgi:hypothetical protein